MSEQTTETTDAEAVRREEMRRFLRHYLDDMERLMKMTPDEIRAAFANHD